MAELVGSVHEFTHEQFVKCMSNEAFRNFILEEVQPYIEEYEKQKSELDKIHDKIFKNILSDKKEAARLINKKFRLKLKPEDIEKLIKELNEGGGKIMLAIKERIDEQFKMKEEIGRKKGREEGEEHGVKIGERIGRKERKKEWNM